MGWGELNSMFLLFLSTSSCQPQICRYVINPLVPQFNLPTLSKVTVVTTTNKILNTFTHSHYLRKGGIK